MTSRVSRAVAMTHQYSCTRSSGNEFLSVSSDKNASFTNSNLLLLVQVQILVVRLTATHAATQPSAKQYLTSLHSKTYPQHHTAFSIICMLVVGCYGAINSAYQECSSQVHYLVSFGFPHHAALLAATTPYTPSAQPISTHQQIVVLGLFKVLGLVWTGSPGLWNSQELFVNVSVNLYQFALLCWDLVLCAVTVIVSVGMSRRLLVAGQKLLRGCREI